MKLTIGAAIVAAPSFNGGEPMYLCEPCHARVNCVGEPAILGFAHREVECALCGNIVRPKEVLLSDEASPDHAA